ncbi:MAG: DUF2165 domain-containing protein [Gemmatimonadaceae bacterium]|nr:DUF2165 domain-containing protein [Gemmatimonadaceae bacterium]
MVRACKALLVGATGLYLALVAFNNVTDYGSNLQFVQHVLSMDTTFPGNALLWRAIRAPWVHHAFYVTIIAWEIRSAVLLLLGAWRLWAARRAPRAFVAAKGLALLGLTSNLLQWLVAFLTVGGEWFAMWQSNVWNGSETAGRMFTVVGIVLLFVSAPESEGPAPEVTA